MTPSLRILGPSGLLAVSSRNNFSLAEKNSLLNLRIPAQLGVFAALGWIFSRMTQGVYSKTPWNDLCISGVFEVYDRDDNPWFYFKYFIRFYHV